MNPGCSKCFPLLQNISFSLKHQNLSFFFKAVQKTMHVCCAETPYLKSIKFNRINHINTFLKKLFKKVEVDLFHLQWSCLQNPMSPQKKLLSAKNQSPKMQTLYSFIPSIPQPPNLPKPDNFETTKLALFSQHSRPAFHLA